MISPTWPAQTLFAVTKSDTAEFAPHVRQVYVGTTGDVSVTTSDDVTVVFKTVPAGSSIGPFFIKRVNSTGTTASNMVAFV